MARRVAPSAGWSEGVPPTLPEEVGAHWAEAGTFQAKEVKAALAETTRQERACLVQRTVGDLMS